MAKWWLGEKTHSKAKLSPADGVAGWCKKCVVSWVLMGWHHLTRCLCVHTSRPESCFSASEAVWRRLEWVCLFSCQALSVRPYWTNSSPVRRRRPIDHWWRCSKSRLIRHHIFTARREWRVSLTLTYFKNAVIQTLCALILGEKWKVAAEPSGRLLALCLLIVKFAPRYSG